MASVDFKTFLSAAPIVLGARYPVILRGRHGIGKSEIVYQIEKSLDYTTGIVERRASQMTEGDLIGLPSISEDKSSTQWNPPDWFMEACSRGVLLFLDEIDRAIPEVRQGIFELTDSRKINGYSLHDDTVIVAAVNGGDHSSEYQVGEMDPAELDRYTVFDVEPTVEDWLTWAKSGKVNHLIWDFINQNRSHLEHLDSFEPNKVYPSRRSWVRLDNTLSEISADMLSQDDSMMFTLSQAFVGFEAAISFRDFAVNYGKQVTVEDIIHEGKIDVTKDFDINQHGALIEKMEASGIFNTLLLERQLLNLAGYFVSIPGEMAMKLFSIIGKSQLRENILNFHGTEVDGRRIGDHVVSLVSSLSDQDDMELT
jgi:hypothetical protein